MLYLPKAKPTGKLAKIDEEGDSTYW